MYIYIENRHGFFFSVFGGNINFHASRMTIIFCTNTSQDFDP